MHDDMIAEKFGWKKPEEKGEHFVDMSGMSHPKLMQAQDREYSSFFVNQTKALKTPYYTLLGFADGALKTDDDESNTNVTACRLDSIRMGNNATLLAWYGSLGYSADRVVRYVASSLTQSYPYSFHCYYSYEEAKTLVESDDFFAQSYSQMLTDAAYETRNNTDAIRRILKLFTEVHPERVEAGLTGF